VAAVEEERFRRVKHCAGFPAQAIASCLRQAGVSAQDVGHVAISRDPRANMVRRAMFVLRHPPSMATVRDRLRNRRRVQRAGGDVAAALGGYAPAVHAVEHHPAHLASAFFVSPFEEAAVCALDGFGDFVSTSTAVGRGRRLLDIERTFFPHSLGLLYLALTQFLGFWSYGDEYKVMGLAAYGLPDYADRMRRLVRLSAGGRFTLDLSYFRHSSEGVSMMWEDGVPVIGPTFTPKLEALLGPARAPEAPVTERHQAIAASLQTVFEEAAVHVLGALQQRSGLRRLCLAGGCAMNSVLNGRIRERTDFEEVYVQPAAADNGTALGAALYTWHETLGHPRAFVMTHASWGPQFSADEVTAAVARYQPRLREAGCRVVQLADEAALCAWAARRIADGGVVGWFQGRMEWGARALGNRSILADPRRADIRELLNTKIKLRETFRPFAPSILEEALGDFFADAAPDPFMLHVYAVRKDKRDVIAAVTHVDGSGRLQTVSRESSPLYWRLIKAFETLTGVPVLLNTSFNENEPIVHTPDEALDCFARTRMDALAMGLCVVERIPAHVKGT
jgi:carbamoyltransferase